MRTQTGGKADLEQAKAKVTDELGQFTIQAETPAEEVLALWHQYKSFKAKWRDAEKRFRQQMTDWLAHNGALYSSPTESVRAASIKKTVCVDRLQTYLAVNNAISKMNPKARNLAIKSLLSSQPFRSLQFL